MKKMILFSCFFAAMRLAAVPITVISPSKVDNTSGYIISTTGTYLLSDDIIFNYSGAAGTFAAIYITSSNVTLDLNGKLLTATTQVSSGATVVGVSVDGAAGNVTIKNGSVISRDIAIRWTGNSLGGLADNLNLTGLSNSALTITSAFGIIVQNCTIRSNKGLSASGEGHRIVNCKFLEGATVGVSANNTVIQDCTVERGRASAAFLITGQACVLDHCVSISCVNGSIGGTGFFLAGKCGVAQNCSAYSGGFGFSVVGDCSMVKGSLAVGNAVNGFVNNNFTAAMIGNIAFGNGTPDSSGSGSGTANYAGSGPVAYVQVNNGGQLPPGSVVDPQIDNISIV